jgi:FMN phosphatase YigB (HAD superfamily)
LYIAAARKLGVEPRHALVIEDHEASLLNAGRAGIATAEGLDGILELTTPGDPFHLVFMKWDEFDFDAFDWQPLHAMAGVRI